MVLDHHASGHHGTLDWETERQHHTDAKDQHMEAMAGLAHHYNSRRVH